MSYEELARHFIATIERGASDKVAAMLAVDAEQVELPNRLTPTGATRDRATILAAGERGRKSWPPNGTRS